MLILSVTKGIVGFLSGSIALFADAAHSFSDIFASIAVWFGLRFAQKKPSERFPYGFYRVETLALLIVSIIIIVSGVEIILESIERFQVSYQITFPSITIIVAGISVVISFMLSRYKIKVGKSIGSQALIGEGKHSRVDAYSSIMVVLAVIFYYFGIPWMEAVAGLVISLLVLKLGLWMGKDAILVLLDVCLKPERLQRIREIAQDVAGVMAVHNVKVRRAGPFIFGEMHLEVDETLAVDKAHEISKKVEDKVKYDIREMDSLTIHIEPSVKDSYRLAIPLAENKGLESGVHSHFGGSPYYILLDVEKGEIIDWRVNENPGAQLERRKGIEAAHFLLENKVDALVTIEMGEGPFHVLKDGMVKIYHLPQNMEVKKIVKEFLGKRLKPMRTPPKIKRT